MHAMKFAKFLASLTSRGRVLFCSRPGSIAPLSIMLDVAADRNGVNQVAGGQAGLEGEVGRRHELSTPAGGRP